MNDHDIRALYEYLRSIPSIDTSCRRFMRLVHVTAVAKSLC
jgi:hypothetical protein